VYLEDSQVRALSKLSCYFHHELNANHPEHF
jgi:hypothetical protein